MKSSSTGRLFSGHGMLQRVIGNARDCYAADHYAVSYDLAVQDADAAAFHNCTPDDTIECIRQLLAAVPATGNQQARDNAIRQLTLLQGRRDSMQLSGALMQNRRVVNYTDVIMIVCASGLMRSADDTRAAFEYALRVSVKDLTQRDYLLEQLRKNVHMSGTSIRRNRLVVHMAMCLSKQDEMERLASSGKYMVFRTIDLTPERGWEWVDQVPQSWKS